MPPIRPEQINQTFPEKVYEAFNALIQKNFSGNSATVKQQEVVDAMISLGLKKKDIDKNGWLNVEKAYEKAGWTVQYDKPGYNESYEAFFVFSKKRT